MESAAWLQTKRHFRDYLLSCGKATGTANTYRLRATFATTYMEQFGDIQALQGVMGHESITTTARYAEYTRQKRGLDQMRRLSFD